MRSLEELSKSPKCAIRDEKLKYYVFSTKYLKGWANASFLTLEYLTHRVSEEDPKAVIVTHSEIESYEPTEELKYVAPVYVNVPKQSENSVNTPSCFL